MDYIKKAVYIQNDEGKSVGFAVIEEKNGMQKIKINLNCPYYDEDGELFVELLLQNGEVKSIGTMNLKYGQGEFRYMGMSMASEIDKIYMKKEEKVVFTGFNQCMEEEKVNLFWDRDRIFIFSDDDIYDCVEITPEDIKKLPSTNWGLINNSFLNHAYYAYRHLIFGRQDKGYIIGVPGFYTRRDKSMANMFGFMHFKFSMRSDIRLSQFGYWYRSIDTRD